MDEEDICVICLEPITKSFYTFACKHKIHNHCFKSYLYYHYDIAKDNISCPTCRQSHDIKLEHIINILLLLKSSEVF